jgi:hypothetical protein
MNCSTSLLRGSPVLDEPNRRQELAMERIERAVGELASVLLASCPSHTIARLCICDIRKAVAPGMDDILNSN